MLLFILIFESKLTRLSDWDRWPLIFIPFRLQSDFKIIFQMNFSWLPTTWRSTFYGTLPENFIIISANLGNKRSYMDPNTSSIMEVSKVERKLKENYKQNIRVPSLTCPYLTGKLITSFIFFKLVTTILYPIWNF